MSTKWPMHSLNDLSAKLTEDVPLAPLTTFRIGGPARLLFQPHSEAELCEVLRWLDENNQAYRILGGGSNILVRDEGWPGAVIRLCDTLAGIDFDGTRVTAGGGALLVRLVAECASRGLSGAECLVGIPGTIGGALVMNAGGRYGHVGPLVHRVRVYAAGRLRDLAGDEISFAYRSSSLAGSVVVSAELELKLFPGDAVCASMRKILLEKRRLQPVGAKSAGCVFKNPPGAPPAGALIEKAGLKGAWVGGAKISELHANYIVNTGGATACDVRRLIERVRREVYERFDVELELEIEMW